MKLFSKKKTPKKILINPLFFYTSNCKFCYGYASHSNKLHNVCNCKGTMMWSHTVCLHEWIKYKTGDKRVCDICLAPYIIPKAR